MYKQIAPCDCDFMYLCAQHSLQYHRAITRLLPAPKPVAPVKEKQQDD